MNRTKLSVKQKIKKMILSGLHDLYDFMWGDFSLLGKFMVLLFVFLPIIFLAIALIFNVDRDNSPILFGLGSLSSFIISIDLIIFFIYMMGSKKRRRILYLLIAVSVWFIYGCTLLFSDDPDMHERMLNMALVGSIWFLIPLFLTFFTIIVIVSRDD